MDPVSGGSVAPARNRRNRLGRSIAQSQLLVSTAMLLLVAIALVVDPVILLDPLFSSGVLLMFLLTALAMLVPWDPREKKWSIALPFGDILAISLVREGFPMIGAGLLLVLPVLWLARNYHLLGAIGGTTLATVLLWTSWLLRGDDFAASDLAAGVLLPLTLAFIATTTYATSRRTAGQRTLLRQQTTQIEGALARARTKERMLDEVLNAVEFGVIAFDREGEITLVNDSHRASLDSFGVSRTAVMHPVAYQADRVTPHPESSRPLARALAGQSFENLVIWVGDPGGDRVAFSVTSRALTAPEGERDGGVVVLRDITAELEAIRARDDLVGSVSHELNTPLTSILGYLELALDEELPDDARHMIDIAHRNAGRMHGLVTDLLRAGSGADTSLPMAFEPCDITEIVRGSVDTQQLAASARGITIVSRLPAHAATNADALRIRQVIDNLMTNAIKYNRPDGTITVSVDVHPSSIEVRVADTGYGISKTEQARLFDRFYRTESARQSTTTGSGLGLSITREIVRQHGGNLVVDSVPGDGSEFTMTLPSFEQV